MEHDLAVYPANANQGELDFLEELKVQFFAQPFVHKLCEIIDSAGLRFGALKEWIQNNCSDIPMPYRRDLTEITQATMRWFEALDSKTFEVVVPGQHSEVLRRKI